jgi:hypothetical protein
VRFSAPVRYRAALAPGQTVGLPDGASARVVAVAADTDPASQSLRVRAGGRRRWSLPGQQFAVTLQLPAPDGSLAVPAAALLPAGGGHVLYRLEGRRVRRWTCRRCSAVMAASAWCRRPGWRRASAWSPRHRDAEGADSCRRCPADGADVPARRSRPCSRLIEFSLRQRVLVLLAVLALAGGGVAAFLHLPIDAYPDISPTQVKLILKAPGMTPEEVEARVITPLEMELLGAAGRDAALHRQVRHRRHHLDFAEGTDIYWARQQVAERYGNVAPPARRRGGGLAPISTPLSDVFMFTIEGGGLSLAERRTLLDWTLRPALRTLPGVADVNVLGGQARSFEVVPDRARLSAAGLHFRDVTPSSATTATTAPAAWTPARSADRARRRRDPHAGRRRRHRRRRHAGARRRRGPGAHRRADPLRRGHPRRPGRGGGRASSWACAAPMPRRWSRPSAPGWTNSPSLPPGVVVPFYDRSTLISARWAPSSRRCWKPRCWW